MRKLFLYRKKIFKPYIEFILRAASSLTYLSSFVLLLGIIYEYGFLITPSDRLFVHKIYEWVRWTFLCTALLHWILSYKSTLNSYRKSTWILHSLLLFTFLGDLLPLAPPLRWLEWLQLLSSNYYLRIAILGVFSFMSLSNGIMLLLTKQVKQSAVFSISFLIIILVGAGMLMLPKATYDYISFVDALFISTSATCVTGLTTVDIVSTFTPMGIAIIMLLIQIGGIGVMTITCFFAMSFLKNASISNQVQLSDMLSSKSLNSIGETIKYILLFTLVIEAMGALLIWVSIHDTLYMSLNEEVAFAVFHSISAFCNAGFSTLDGNLGNQLLMYGHNMFYVVISLLIVFGGIGFPILVNAYEAIRNLFHHLKMRYIYRRRLSLRTVHRYSTNTRIVVIMTLILILTSTLTIAILEWNHAFAYLPITDKIVQSFFTAVCPRTAGFNSFAISSFSVQTILLIMILMMIGGGTQSTAGGIKVNVFAVVLLNLKAILFGTNKVTVFGRRLVEHSVRSSNSTLILYLCFMFLGVFTLSFMEPDADLMALLFECISALSTVGASLDLTSTLQNDSKLVIILLMFVGRIGVLTMISSLIPQHTTVKCMYPSDNIIIN